MDFSDEKHSMAELVFQGATELDLMEDFGEEEKNTLAAWRNRSDPHSPGAELLHLPDCPVFSITYDGVAGNYWPDETANEMTETLIRQFLYREGICALKTDRVRLICMKYQIMALDGDEDVLICPYFTEAGNIGGVVVVCVTKLIHDMERPA